MWLKEREWLNRVIPTDKPIKLLDLGCGPGWASLNILREFPNVHTTCLDTQQAFIDHAEKKMGDEFPGRFQTMLGRVKNFSLPDASFDVVYTRLVLQHIADIKDVLSEINRVLKPGGTFIMLDSDESMGDAVLPRVPAVEVVLEVLNTHRKSHEQLSLRLWDWISTAGFNKLRYDTLSYHSSELVPDVRARLGVMAHPKAFYSLAERRKIKKKKVDRAVGVYGPAKW